MRARPFIVMIVSLASLAGHSAFAGPWGFEPSLGVSGDYSSNPILQTEGAAAETHVAALVNLPLNYDADSTHVSLIPRARFSDSAGYASLASNFAHLDANAQFGSDLGSFGLQGQLARDSSLDRIGGLSQGLGVRRDSNLLDANAARALSGRTQLQLDLSWTSVRFDQPENLTSLADYRYLSFSPSFAFNVTELTTLKLLGSLGRYQSLNGLTQSKSENLQLGFVRQLTEIWSLSTSIGYSRSRNSEKEFFGPFFLGDIKSDQNGAVYAATATRQGDRFSFSGSVSRALQPTGFAFLARQDSVNLGGYLIQSERWAFNAVVDWQKALYPAVNGSSSNRRFLNARLSADWHWTPQWTISMHASRITQVYGQPSASATSNGLSLEIVRQFLRVEL